MELRPGKDVPAFDLELAQRLGTHQIRRETLFRLQDGGWVIHGWSGTQTLHCWVKIGKVEAWEWLRDGDLPIPEDLEEPDPWGLEWSGRA
jgi:hypothetical protein